MEFTYRGWPICWLFSKWHFAFFRKIMIFRDFRAHMSLCARKDDSLGRAIELPSLWDVFLISWPRDEPFRADFGAKILDFPRKSTVRSYSKLDWILGFFSLLSRAKNLFACREAPNGLYISFLDTPRGVPASCQTEFSKSVSDSICSPRNFQ